MASKPETIEEDSFIILGTSPGTSLDLKYNSFENRDVSLDTIQLDDALKDLSAEASMAFKAHFKLGDCPSPASLMVASTIITDDKSTEELQKRFGELLDENVILKETLEKNNESMKEQFLLIASCQEDMMKTHMVHKEKFDETRELVEKLRQENKRLKLDVARLAESDAQSGLSGQLSQIVHSVQSDEKSENLDNETGEHGKSGPSSALEFVTSPDDDTINKLTAQLELVEKQRRQVIVDNEKLSWQKESLEHIVDATTKERDDLKEKLKNLELQLYSVENDNAVKINNLNAIIKDLNDQLEAANSITSVSSADEVSRRDVAIQQLEAKVSALQNDLKQAQLKILNLESVKLEFTKHKSGTNDSIKIYRDQIQELRNSLKEARTTVFQPVRFSMSAEGEPSAPEYASFLANVKLYDKTLKHLAELLNLVMHGSTDVLVQALGVVASLHDFKLDRSTAEQFKSGLSELKQQLEKQNTLAWSNVGQVRSSLTIFEGIFKDYDALLQKSIKNNEDKPPNAPNVGALTAALVARGQELQSMEAELNKLRNHKEDHELLKAQLELYKSDFEAEREARQKMASDRETLLTDLRTTQRRNQELILQLEEVSKINPNIYKAATSKRFRVPAGEQAAQSGNSTASRRPAASGNAATGNMVYTCPKCMRFSSDQYKVMEDHFDFCFDDF